MNNTYNNLTYTISIRYNAKKKAHELHCSEPNFDANNHPILSGILEDINKLRYKNQGCLLWWRKGKVSENTIRKLLEKYKQKCWLHYKLVDMSKVKDSLIKFKDIKILCLRMYVNLLKKQRQEEENKKKVNNAVPQNGIVSDC